MTPVSRREQNRQAKRASIQAAAEHLFQTLGYEQTTAKMVADRAGVANGTVFLYAKDKDDLLFLVMHDRLSRGVDEAFRTLRPGPLLQRLSHVFKRVFRVYAAVPTVGRAFVRVLPGARGLNADLVNALTLSFMQRVAMVVQQAQAAGEVRREVDPLLAASNCFALYFFTLLAWLNGHLSSEAVDQALSAALALQIDGLAR